jgi:hypothetical protein
LMAATMASIAAGRDGSLMFVLGYVAHSDCSV